MHHPKIYERTLGPTKMLNVISYLVENYDYAVAIDENRLVGVTWNPTPDFRFGYPHTFEHQQWFILPPPIGQLLLAGARVFEAPITAESPLSVDAT
jgi:hypothetical protein